jgi:hypothetical protein
MLALALGACHTQVPPRGAGESDSVEAPRMVHTGGAASVAAPALQDPGRNLTPLPAPPVPAAEQQKLMSRGARGAWAFVQRNYQPATGLVKAHDTYEFVTAWDIGSALAAMYSARELRLIGAGDYQTRMSKALQTLATMPLYDGVAFNKFYSARTGQMIGRDERRTDRGYGWSALDVGRLLVWLKIVGGRDAALEPAARQVAARLALNQMVNGGYLHGRDLDPRDGDVRNYQEGRIGYEQYAAEGFALWGARADRAIGFETNLKLVTVDGFTIPADRRGGDLLTSEPFVMMGMEVGWPTAEWRDISRRVYDAQQQRYQRTGIVTMLSEDAVPEPPAYFYYYLLYHNGKAFVVTVPGGGAAPERVRWVSTKAAFGWHALLPSDYTWLALQTVQPAGAGDRGWTAGVFESSKQSTHAANLNTAAVVLEAAAYSARGCALAQPTCGGGASSGPAQR